MRNILLFVLPAFIFVSSPLFAQDGIVDRSDLVYSSKFEREVFTDFLEEKKAHPFDLFMAGGTLLTDDRVSDARKRFYTYLEQFKEPKVAAKKNDKKAKYVYDAIHKSFLNKYKESTSFEEVFYNGNYNCVSGSALYALAFEEIGIPYVIKEEPTHVYLIAYPETERIKIETTTPVRGVLVLNTSFKQQFVKTLRDQKLISAQEYGLRSSDELFDQHYFANQESVTLSNLAGIQYMNAAIERNNERKFEEAAQLMDKAYVLFPAPRTAYLLMTMTAAAFEARKQKDSIHAQYLTRLSRFTSMGVTHEMIAGEFGRAINTLLFEKGKRDEAQTYYRVAVSRIQHHELKNDMEFTFHFESGRLAYQQARYKDATAHFESALVQKPSNVDGINMLIASIGQRFSSHGPNTERISTLEHYMRTFPSLSENNIFNSLLASTYLIQCGLEYDQDKPAQAEKYRVMFEEFIAGKPDLPVNADLLGHAYSRAAIFFYRKGQTAKAKAILNSGLKLAPDNYELLARKRMIN
jgi:tetratricopeptide (TPR) repeat protein